MNNLKLKQYLRWSTRWAQSWAQLLAPFLALDHMQGVSNSRKRDTCSYHTPWAESKLPTGRCTKKTLQRRPPSTPQAVQAGAKTQGHRSQQSRKCRKAKPDRPSWTEEWGIKGNWIWNGYPRGETGMKYIEWEAVGQYIMSNSSELE